MNGVRQHVTSVVVLRLQSNADINGLKRESTTFSAMAEVEIYTNRGCGACVRAKQLLDKKGISYEEKKLGKSKKIDREFSIRTRGAKSIPQIFIDNHWIGGFDDLVKYDKDGELNWRLGLEDRPQIGLAKKLTRLIKGEKY